MRDVKVRGWLLLILGLAASGSSSPQASAGDWTQVRQYLADGSIWSDKAYRRDLR